MTTVTLSVIYYIEWRAQNQVGQYIARDVVTDLIGWGVALPGMTWDYVGLGSVVEIAALVVAILAIAIVAQTRPDSGATSARRFCTPEPGWALRVPAFVILSGAIVLAAIGFASRSTGFASQRECGRPGVCRAHDLRSRTGLVQASDLRADARSHATSNEEPALRFGPAARWTRR